ncbi:MAG: hypothetical protein ACHQAY_27965 [Hyphomicrobiales bacterium]
MPVPSRTLVAFAFAALIGVAAAAALAKGPAFVHALSWPDIDRRDLFVTLAAVAILVATLARLLFRGGGRWRAAVWFVIAGVMLSGQIFHIQAINQLSCEIVLNHRHHGRPDPCLAPPAPSPLDQPANSSRS